MKQKIVIPETAKNNKNKHPLKLRWGIVRSLILALIRFYRKFLSPAYGNQCRFYPTCSGYAYLCFLYLPMPYAFYFTTKRILKCNPYKKGGFDYPPGMSEKDNELIDKHLKI
ncbi:MAG: membrane protein insertion efficiency factor YidD [Spirochaetia bacterium]|nr:membrane protein insertion efficiency factor YidD [Spirochaetia bacterium]